MATVSNHIRWDQTLQWINVVHYLARSAELPLTATASAADTLHSTSKQYPDHCYLPMCPIPYLAGCFCGWTVSYSSSSDSAHSDAVVSMGPIICTSIVLFIPQHNLSTSWIKSLLTFSPFYTSICIKTQLSAPQKQHARYPWNRSIRQVTSSQFSAVTPAISLYFYSANDTQIVQPISGIAGHWPARTYCARVFISHSSTETSRYKEKMKTKIVR